MAITLFQKSSSNSIEKLIMCPSSYAPSRFDTKGKNLWMSANDIKLCTVKNVDL